MANYYESVRTNYFKVNDLEAFKQEVSTWAGEVDIVGNSDDEVALLFDSETGLAYLIYDEETGEETEIDYQEVFKRHLADDYVAIIVGAGAEKLRYISGYAIAFNNKGESVGVNLQDIYLLSKPLGNKITQAEY